MNTTERRGEEGAGGEATPPRGEELGGRGGSLKPSEAHTKTKTHTCTISRGAYLSGPGAAGPAHRRGPAHRPLSWLCDQRRGSGHRVLW